MSPQLNSQLPADLAAVFDNAAAGQRGSVETVRLSDIDHGMEPSLAIAWRGMPVDARRFLVREMISLAEENLVLNFSRVLRSAISDSDEEVRALAIQGLWEDESSVLLDQLLGLLKVEQESTVLEAAAEALGRFSSRAAIGEIDNPDSDRLRIALLDLLNSNEPPSVRQSALESVAYFTDDPEIEAHISNAYDSGDQEFRISAIVAMGRNLADRWLDYVLEDLEDYEGEIRRVAAEAAGEFEDERAIDRLVGRIEDEEPDVRTAALEALGKIGGRMAIQALREAMQSQDETITVAAREALSQILQPDNSIRLEP